MTYVVFGVAVAEILDRENGRILFPSEEVQGHHYNGDQAARRPQNDVLNL